jgi:hypothetical protein
MDGLFRMTGAADTVDLVDRIEAQGRWAQVGWIVAGVGVQRIVALELLVIRVAGGRRPVRQLVARDRGEREGVVRVETWSPRVSDSDRLGTGRARRTLRAAATSVYRAAQAARPTRPGTDDRADRAEAAAQGIDAGYKTRGETPSAVTSRARWGQGESNVRSSMPAISFSVSCVGSREARSRIVDLRSRPSSFSGSTVEGEA